MAKDSNEEAPHEGLRALLDDPDVSENDLQAYLERHTELLPNPHLLNHQIHFRSVISKFAIGKWKTDYAFLTKSSVEWRLVLVELEKPQKRLFNQSGKYVEFSAELNSALSQIRTWRDEVASELPAIRKRIAPLTAHMGGNPLEVWYLLVIGRDAELNTQRRRTRLAKPGEPQLQIMTWDSLLRLQEYGSVDRKCVLTETATGFSIKHMHRIPSHLFAWVGPEHLTVTAGDVAALEADGYDMKAWKSGRLLTTNERFPTPTPEQIAEGIMDAILRNADTRP